MKHPSRSNVLNSILSGTATECGSGCFQTADGSTFLGRPSPESVSEAKRLLAEPEMHARIKAQCKEFLQYVNGGTE